jgi:anionic cell wall polymer biosynthesis LytR-Cps2A-Psr (LCP) family protein
MRSFRLDRSILFLVAILVILVVLALFMFFAMRTNPVSESLSGDKLLKVLVVLEDKGKPVSTNIIAYYPGSKRAAMFDIPGETGLILKSLGRVDRIDAVYKEKGIQEYKAEIENLTGIAVPFYLNFNLDQFARLADLLSGFGVFIPTPVDIKAPSANQNASGTEDSAKRTEAVDAQTVSGRVLLPSGAVTLDGDKIRLYVTYVDPLDQEGERSGRKQKAILAFFRALNDNSGSAFSGALFPAVKSCLKSNAPDSSMKDLLKELSKIDVERLVPQKVTGSQREVDGKMLLFPFEDGGLLKAVIRQTLAGLASEDSTAQERIYAIEILNGTKSQGLARSTSELYQSFGYDVIRVGNAGEVEYEATEIIDRIGNAGVAATIGQVIQCSNIQATNVSPADTGDYGTEASVDFTIILGKDFNGRYVIR